MKKMLYVLIALMLLFISACSEETDSVKDQNEDSQAATTEALGDKPIKGWLKLDTGQKNELMLDALGEAGLEKSVYMEWYRTAIKEMNKLATNPEMQNETIESGLKREVEIVLVYIEDTKERQSN